MTGIKDIHEEVSRLRRSDQACAIATIVRSSGSTPRKAGAKMLVRADGSTLGTVGGGRVEADVIERALSAIRDQKPDFVSFDLSRGVDGLLCGGTMDMFIEPVLPDLQLIIMGGGHVGASLSRIAGFLGYWVAVIDDREEYANSTAVPTADLVRVNDFTNPFQGIVVDASSYIVIATRGHTHDLDALQAALQTDAGFIGLVGSSGKKEALFKSLRRQGTTEDALARVDVPVGLPIGSVTPEEIAVSIVAQIIALRRGHGPGTWGDPARGRALAADRTG